MDIESLKAGFISYLQELEKKDNTDQEDMSLSDLSDISIFTYSKEFKEYISDEYNMSSDILSMSVSDILKLEIVNGKLIDPEDNSQENMPNSDETEQEIPSMLDVMNLIMEDKNFKTQYDTDENGEISQEEFASFQESIKNLNKDNDNLSLDDLFKNLEETGETISAEDEILKTEETEEIEEPETENQTEESPQIQNTTPSNGTPITGGNQIQSINATSTNTPSSSNSALDGMNAEQLESELGTANDDLKDKQDNLYAIQNGTDDVVAPLKQQMQNAFNSYTDALNQQGSKDAEKLAEVTAKIEENETKQRENKEKQQNLNDSINIETKNIETYTTLVNNYDNMIANIDSKISSLESQKISIAQDPENPEIAEKQRNAIQAQIDAAYSEKENLLSEKQNAEELKSKSQEKLTNAQNDLNNIKNSITLTTEELTELKSTQSELEDTILEENPELKQLKENYTNAKQEFLSTKEKANNTAKDEILTAQNRIKEISNKLVDVKKVEADKLYSTNSSKLAAYDSKTGQHIADTAESIYGNKTEGERLCAGGVEKSIRNAIGQRFGGNAYQLADQFAKAEGWSEVTDCFDFDNIKKSYEDGGLPPGAVVVWAQENVDPYGHTFIADGKGNEISDHKQSITVYTKGHFRVFIPTGTN